METTLLEKLPTGTIYESDPLKVTHYDENPEMDYYDPTLPPGTKPGQLKHTDNKRSVEEKLEKWPDRHIIFKVDYSEAPVQDILHHSFTQTAMIDKLRQRFRNMEYEDAMKLRQSWPVDPKTGHRICEENYRELVPKRVRRAAKPLAEQVAGMDLSKLEQLEELIKKQQELLKNGAAG